MTATYYSRVRNFDLSQFSKTVNDLVNTPKEQLDKVKEIVSYLNHVVRAKFGKGRVSYFGSQRYFVLTDASDIDLVLFLSDDLKQDHQGQIDALIKVREAIQADPFTKFNRKIELVKCNGKGGKRRTGMGAPPIIKLKWNNNIDVDLCVQQYDGLKLSELIRRARYADRRFQPLATAVKTFCKDVGIYGARNRFPSSAALMVLLIRWLQNHCVPSVLNVTPVKELVMSLGFDEREGALGETANNGGHSQCSPEAQGVSRLAPFRKAKPSEIKEKDRRSVKQLLTDFVKFCGEYDVFITHYYDIDEEVVFDDMYYSDVDYSYDKKLHVIDPFNRDRNIARSVDIGEAKIFSRCMAMFAKRLEASDVEIQEYQFTRDRISKEQRAAIKKRRAEAMNISQNMLQVNEEEKKSHLMDLLDEPGNKGLTLIFTETKRTASELSYYLYQQDYKSRAIHEDMELEDIQCTLSMFRSGWTPILIATSEVSREFNITNLTHVINYDLPGDIDDYVNRIVLSGRDGNTGKATSFFSHENVNIARDLVQLIKDAKQPVPQFLLDSMIE